VREFVWGLGGVSTVRHLNGVSVVAGGICGVLTQSCLSWLISGGVAGGTVISVNMQNFSEVGQSAAEL